MKKFYTIFSLIIVLLLLNGCWGEMDVNKMSTATAVGIDKSEKGYKVTIQAINASSQTQQLSNRATVVVYSEEGQSVFEALRKLTFYYPSRVLMSHFHLLAFGEDFAKEGVKEVLGFLYNDTETRQKYNIVVVKGGTANDFLKIITPSSPNPAAEVNDSIKASFQSFGSTHVINADEFLSLSSCHLNNPIATTVELIGDPKKGADMKNIQESDLKAKIKTESLAVFKMDKLVGYLTVDESQGYNFLMGEVTSSVIPVTYDKDKKISVEINSTKAKRKLKITDNQVNVNITITIQGFISGLEGGLNGLKPKEVKEIEKKASESISKKIELCIKKTQDDYDSDIFMIGSLIHRSKPKYYHKIDKDYDEVFKNIKINVKVKTTIINTPQ